jgi:ATP-binding cassette, subfamily B, bacterial MsbA
MRAAVMSHADTLSAALDGARTRLPVLHELGQLSRYGRAYIALSPVLLGLGLLSRIAEAAVVGLTVLFLQLAIGRSVEEDQSSAAIQAFVDTVSGLLGTNLLFLGLAVIACLAVRLVSDFALGIIDSRIFNNIGDVLRRDIYQRYLTTPYARLAQHDQADLVNVLENESENVPEAFQTVIELIQEALAVIVFGAMIIIVSWRLGAMAAAGAAMLIVASHFLTRPIQALNAVAIAQHRRMIRVILKGLQGMRAIRAFGQEKAEMSRFSSVSRRLKATHRRIDALQTAIDPFIELGYLILMAGLILVGLRIDPALTSTLTALALLYRVQPHATGLQNAIIKLVAMTPHLSIVRATLEMTQTDAGSWGSRSFPGVRKSIRFADVRMAYPGAPGPALAGVSFEIPAGKTSALLGPSGAGKSTVVNLLLGLYQQDSGIISLDGTPLHDFDRTGWLRRVALAGQDVDVVEGSFAANIRLSKPQASLDEVRRAADIAGILADIEALPDGFASWIGERGTMISGGQRQRIGLARAVLCDPDILILDEATSALDEPMEQRIREGLLKIYQGRTILVITHRLHTVADVDHVIWLESGRVAAQGPPGSLPQLAGRASARQPAGR